MSESANLSRTGQRWWADWAAEHSERRLVMKQKVSAHSTVMPWKVQEMQRWTWGLHYSRIYNGCSGIQEHHHAAGMAHPSGFSLNTTAVVFCITGNILQYHIKSVGQCMLCSLELVWLVLMHGIVPWGEVLVGRLESHHGRAKLISLGMCLLSGAPLTMSDQPSGFLHRLESLGDRAGLTWILMGSETIYKGRSHLEDHWLHQVNYWYITGRVKVFVSRTLSLWGFVFQGLWAPSIS